MSDNLHEFNDEILEQDQIITDLTALTARVTTNETNITTINNLNIANKFAGTVSSGLKTLIEGNDTDITNIETKTDFITVTQNVDLDTMESNVATNNAKVGISTAEQNKLSNISVSSAVNLNTMNTAITTNTNAIDAVELKTDFISVTQNVDLDTIEAKIENIVGSSPAPAPTDNLIIGSSGATNRYVRIGYGNQSNRVGFANEAYFTGGGVYGFEQDNNGDIYIDGYKIVIGSQNLNLTTMNNNITTNNAKVSMVLGTTAGTALEGDTTTITAQQASDITTNNAKVGISTAEQAKLSNISVSSAVNLNTMNTNIATNTSSAGTNSANITNILNNTISSTLKTAVDSIPNKLNNNADDVMAGELKVYKTSDDNHLSVVCDAPNEAVLSVGGNESVQGTALINFGQGITHSTRRGTFGGFLSYEGDSNAEVGSSIRFLQDNIHMGFFTSGVYYPTFHFNNSSTDRNVYFRDGIYVRDKVTTANEYTMNGVIHCDEACRSTTGNLSGWKPTGTTTLGNVRKVMLESPLDEGSGIALSEQGVCIWSADNGLYLVDEDSVDGISYSGFFYHINQSGTVSTSDRNIKRNIRDLSFNRSFCDIINDIEPVLFNWKPHYDITDASGNETERYTKHKKKWETENVGVIAQDLPAEIKQYLMSGDEDDCGHQKPLGVDYVKLTMYLIGAVKELKREIEILKQ